MKRLAGQIFNQARRFGDYLTDGMTVTDKVLRFGPDAAFATMNAINTPGDVVDKLIAGTSDFAGSAGLGLVVAAPFKKMPAVAAGIDQVGSIAGMYGGMAVSDRLQRAKDSLTGGKGLSAYERANVEYENQLTQQLIQDLNSAGLLRPEAAALLTNDNTGMV